MEVAQFLVDGTPKMPARPFFGITELQLNKIISRHADARRITVEPTPRQVEQAGQAIKLITGFDPLKVQVIKSKGLQSVTVSSEKLAVQEVVTTAPTVAEFVPAKTIEEAKERLTKQFIIARDPEELKWLDPDFIKPAVNIDLLSVEGANILLQVLEKENLIRPIKVKMISVGQRG
ncbi:MAG: hypothetical protein IPG99_19990 [Ignavibacteria bacterium]|nr:hypothetical protein [Ignavibacteria bacterium]